MAKMYFQSARRTGRTSLLIESLKDGDRVVCAALPEARRLQKLADARGVNVKFTVVEPSRPELLTASTGRTVFDHSWVEQYYMASLKQCQSDIDTMQRNMSGTGDVVRFHNHFGAGD